MAATPPKFTLPQRREIKRIAKAKPADYDLPFSTWSRSKLAEFLVAEGVVDDISHEDLRLAGRSWLIGRPESVSGIRGFWLGQVERCAFDGEGGQTGFCPAAMGLPGVPANAPSGGDRHSLAIWPGRPAFACDDGEEQCP